MNHTGEPFDAAGPRMLHNGAPSVPGEYLPDTLAKIMPGELVYMSAEDVAIDRGTMALCLNMGTRLDAQAADPPAVVGERVAVMRVMGETIGAEQGKDYYIVDICAVNKGDLDEIDAVAALAGGAELRFADVLITRDRLDNNLVDYHYSKELQPAKGRIKPIALFVSEQTIERIKDDMGVRDLAEAEEDAQDPPERVVRGVARCAVTSEGIHHSPFGRQRRRNPMGD